MNLRKISTGRPRLERKNWLSLKSATTEELRVKRIKLEITHLETENKRLTVF